MERKYTYRSVIGAGCLVLLSGCAAVARPCTKSAHELAARAGIDAPHSPATVAHRSVKESGTCSAELLIATQPPSVVADRCIVTGRQYFLREDDRGVVQEADSFAFVAVSSQRGACGTHKFADDYVVAAGGTPAESIALVIEAIDDLGHTEPKLRRRSIVQVVQQYSRLWPWLAILCSEGGDCVSAEFGFTPDGDVRDLVISDVLD